MCRAYQLQSIALKEIAPSHESFDTWTLVILASGLRSVSKVIESSHAHVAFDAPAIFPFECGVQPMVDIIALLHPSGGEDLVHLAFS